MTNAFELAAFNTVADYSGGAPALAPIIGLKSAAVLNHKVCLTDIDNQLTVPQARRIMQATADYRMLHGLAADLNHICIQGASDNLGAPFERSIAEMAKEFGEYLAVISAAVADDTVTPNELRRIDKELSELVGAANHLRAQCAVMQRRRR